MSVVFVKTCMNCSYNRIFIKALHRCFCHYVNPPEKLTVCPDWTMFPEDKLEYIKQVVQVEHRPRGPRR